MARILIADDRETMRNALKLTIGTHPGWEVCGETDNGREVLAKATELQPDVVVLDFKMSPVNGIKAGSELSASMPNMPIVMYTLYRTPELEVAAKLVGIGECVEKEEGGKNLLGAIESAPIQKT